MGGVDDAMLMMKWGVVCFGGVDTTRCLSSRTYQKDSLMTSHITKREIGFALVGCAVASACSIPNTELFNEPELRSVTLRRKGHVAS